jgi:catechol 2,3-dioxygenase-like lactoylglutathione lyase family enzyme
VGVLDHLSIGVSDLERAAAFYDTSLAPLGYVRLFTHPRAVGYGNPGDKDEQFAILRAGDEARAPGKGCHIAITARTREAVHRFHAAAMGAGATDEGEPGPRPQYGPGYYAAFVRDLDGYRIEVVCHEPDHSDRKK